MSVETFDNLGLLLNLDSNFLVSQADHQPEKRSRGRLRVGFLLYNLALVFGGQDLLKGVQFQHWFNKLLRLSCN